MALSLSFKGKTILVTGAARGLGRDLVETLYSQGAIIIAVSRSPVNLSKLKSDFPNISTIAVDLSNWDETRKALSPVKGVEYLINNAGMVHVQPFMNVTPQHFDDQWNTNVKGVINISQIIAGDMISRGQGGCIINISSMGAKVASKSLGIYDTTKSALDMLTKSMAVELGPHQIRVNSVNPTMFETDMTKTFLENNPNGGTPYQERTPLKRLCQSYEIVNTILFLMSDHAPFINATSVLIDGGYCAN